MGLDLLEGIISGFLSSLLDVLDIGLNGIVDTAFNLRLKLGLYVGSDLSELFSTVKMFGIYLIILKFVKKGFDIYILWTDGDAELDPFILLTNFFKAIIVAISFDTLYEILINIAKDMTDIMLGTMNSVEVDGLSVIVMAIIPNTRKGAVIAWIVIAVVFVIMIIMLWIQFTIKGIELLILNTGIPIACMGLLDSDGGVFKPYIKKMFQEIFAIMIQVIMLKFALLTMMNNHPFVAIASMSMALKAPQFLSEFIMVSNGGGAVQKVTSAMYMTSMIKSFVK